MLKRSWRALLLAGAAFLLVTGAAHAVDFTPGASGLGDPFFPNAGNGGYDVSHYDLTLDYTPSGNQLAGTAVITATATQNLSRFNLDLRGFDISRLLVNGAAASFTRDGVHELVITPTAGIRAGRTFTVTIDYAGTPAVVTDPDGSIEGWVPTDDGAFVVDEPQGSPALVPRQRQPARQGDLRLQRHRAGRADGDGQRRPASRTRPPTARRPGSGARPTRWRRTSRRQRSAASTSTISSVDGIPSYVAVDPTLPKGNVLRKLPEIVRFYASIYGPYPFNAVGSDRRRRQGRRLLARDADEADVRPDARRADARARALPHVVRRLGHAHAVAGHLAARGVRHLVGVDLERVLRQQDGAEVLRQPLQHARPGHGVLDAAARRCRARRRSCSTGRSTTAAG